MTNKFFEELSRCLGKEQIESLSKEDRRLEIFLHGQPVLSVSPGNEVFMLPSGSKNPEANELYHRVAIAADRVFEYVEAMENTPLLRARGLDNKFHLLADFGGAVLAGRERGTGRGYEFVTWIWDYERVGVSHGHYYEDDFAGAKRDFAVRSGLIPRSRGRSGRHRKRRRYGDGMKKEDFWNLIDETNQLCPTHDQESIMAVATDKLLKLSVKDILDFHMIQQEYFGAAYRNDLHAKGKLGQ